MMTRSIVGRFLILAVLLVSLGVIAQAALIITRGSGRAVAKANAAPVLTPASVQAADAGTASAPPARSPEAAPIRVVYPGPLGDSPIQPRKFADAAPATPTAPVAAAQQAPAAQPVVASAPAAAPAPVALPVAAPAPEAVAPAPEVVASAEADTQPAPDAALAGKGGVNLNSASVDALNHLGGGHIGQTIVRHRPYGSVEDLVKKRVVRRSVYEQIKNQVAAQ